MTAPYTQSAQFNPSVLLANNAAQTNKISDYSINTDTSFDTVFDNAAKSYADKTETASVADKTDYAQKTKYVQNAKNETSSKTDKNEIKDTPDNKKENIADKANQTDKNNKTQEKEESQTENKIDTDKNDKKTETQPQETENIKENDTQNSDTQEEVSLKPEAAQTLAAAALSDGEITLKTETVPDTESLQKTDSIDVNSKQNKNAIANEQLLANIEYADGTDLDAQTNVNIDVDESTLKKVVEQAKKQKTDELSQPAASDIKVQQPDVEKQTAQKTVDTQSVKITDSVQAADTNVAAEKTAAQSSAENIQNLKNQTEEVLPQKTAQENLAADTSRLTANVEQMQPDAEVVTPAKTEAEKVPTIKVTQEVAATVQEQKSTGIENKDNTSKIKDKAVEQMTKLQDTDTVVTEAKTHDSAENSGSSGSGNNSAQANAGETAAKMNVEHASNINSQPADAQNFVSKLEAQLSAKSAESNRGILNQSDIMSQVNSKFEQLQQSGTNKVSIVLQPENLGKVSVEIMNSKDGIVAKMTTDNQQVKELFDKNVEALKNNLSSQGVNVNNIKVECTNESSNNAMNFERNQFEQSFNNQQNPHGNHANQSDKDAKTTYTADFGNANDFDEQTEPNQGVEIKNTQTIIKHNGKVDYTV